MTPQEKPKKQHLVANFLPKKAKTAQNKWFPVHAPMPGGSYIKK